MLQELGVRTEQFYYKGLCDNCNTLSTFNQDKYCNCCGSYHDYEVERLIRQMGPFTLEAMRHENGFNPEVSQDVLNDILKTNRVINTKNKSKTKKGNFMKNSLSKIGTGIAKGICKGFGATHFVVQTTADVICAAEAGFRATALNEKDKQKSIENRKIATAQRQIAIATKAIELHEKAKEKVSIKRDKEQTVISVQN